MGFSSSESLERPEKVSMSPWLKQHPSGRRIKCAQVGHFEVTSSFSSFDFNVFKGTMGKRQWVFCRDLRVGIHHWSNLESERKVPNAHSEALSQVHKCERLVQMRIHVAVWSPKLP